MLIKMKHSWDDIEKKNRIELMFQSEEVNKEVIQVLVMMNSPQL